MSLKTALLSSALASLLLATPALAEPGPAPGAQKSERGECHGGKGGKEGRLLHKMARMERKLDRAVEKGRLTPVQAEQFKAEARQLREELQAQHQASNGQLTEEQKQQFKQRKQALREKVKAALQAANVPQGV
jgi:uncharacterized coiled-coil DUF342 family protein